MPDHSQTVDNGDVANITDLPFRRYPERFMSVFTASMAHIASFDRPAAYHRVLWFAMSKLDALEFKRLSARQCASGTGLSKSHVERALSMLAADRVIINQGVSSDLERRLSRRLGWYRGATLFNEAELLDTDLPIIDARGRKRGRPGVDLGTATELQEHPSVLG